MIDVQHSGLRYHADIGLATLPSPLFERHERHAHSAYAAQLAAGVDVLELLDAANELDCGCLEGRAHGPRCTA